MLINNPAARLYVILDEARRVSGPKLTIGNVWRQVLCVESEEMSELLHAIGHLLELSKRARSEVEALEGVNHDIYLRPFGKIEILLSQMNLAADSRGMRETLDAATMTGLAFCVDTLSVQRPEKTIRDEELAELQSVVAELTERILQSNLDASLKALLLNHLEHIRLAIVQYRISGSEGLTLAADASLGSLFRHRSEVSKANDKGVFHDFFDLLTKIDILVSVTDKTKELLAPVYEMIIENLPQLPPPSG